MPTVMETRGPNTNINKYDRAALDPKILGRVLSSVHYEGDCWIWDGALNDRGYGVIQFGHRTTLYVHRLTYRIVKGELSNRMVLDHLCRVPRCVNPLHTEQVTQAENTRRGVRGELTHCAKQHPYTAENTRAYTDAKGFVHRICVQCNKDRSRAWYEKKRDSALAETLRVMQ